MFVILSLILFLTVIAYVYHLSLKNVWNEKGIFHLRRNIVFGNVAKTFFLQESIPALMKRIYDAPRDKSTKLVGFYIFNRPALLIRDASLLKYILVKDFSNFSRRTMHVSQKHDEVASTNPFSDRTARWKPKRTSLTPIFTSGKLKKMFSVMEEISGDLLTKLKMEHKSPIDLRELSAKFTIDVISTTALGLNANCLKDEESQFRKFGKHIFSETRWRTFELFLSILSPTLVELLRTRLFSQKATESLSEIFWGIVNEREEKKFKRNDLIDLFIELKNKGKIEEEEENGVGDESDVGKGFTKVEILGTAVSFFAAGFETTASTMTYTLYELALNKDIQNRARVEVHELIRKYNNEISYEAIQDMRYVGWCIDEALRKYTISGWLNRECVADYHIPGDTNLIIDKGTEIFVSLDGIQLNPEYFPDPNKFDPERFSNERKHEIKPFTFLPFGAGPRNCIGMRFGLLSARYGIATIIANYNIELTSCIKEEIEFANLSIFKTPKHCINVNCVPVTSRS